MPKITRTFGKLSWEPEKAVQNQWTRNEEVAALYHTPRWRRLRKVVLNNEPICKICKIAMSDTVDHKTPVSKGGDFWDIVNLQGVCKPCNNKKKDGK